MSTTHNLAKSIFLNALEFSSAKMRKEYLDSECGGNASLRCEVEELLSHQESLGDFLCEPASDVQSTVDYDSTNHEHLGTQIGPYKLLEQIGEGGFGVVFLAEQTSPVRREVALKIVKAGMDTKEVISRFEAERQALALMDHPNIAKVLDGGTTESGRPYFVMELVPGIPITDYCDQCKLTTQGRLQLYLTVCQAVQHAHQKGVIHRDLKPSNILVAMQDDTPTPKIIDFGVAKAINQRLTENTLRTRFAQMVGTPLYMSPEQAELSPLRVDTRSDIYSLGVLLYELLTGTTPFDKDRLHSASFDQLRHIIREEEPPRPSTRLSTLSADQVQTVADRHRAEARQLTQSIRGDLDWIVMKAMEKDRTRRYATANGLARDVERYLNDEPVEACPPSRVYRFRKYLRRHKLVIATLTIVMGAVLTGSSVACWQAIRATSERNRAVAAEKAAAAEAARSEQVATLLKDMLATAGPSVARGHDATLLREVLAKTADRVEHDLDGQPEVQGDLWYTLGITYQDIGDRRTAADLLKKAVFSHRQDPGNPSTVLALSLARLGLNQSYLGLLADGVANAQLAVDMARTTGDMDTLAECLVHRANACQPWNMSSDEGLPYLEEALDLYRELGSDQVAMACCLVRVGGSIHDFQQAISLTQEAYQILLDQLGEDHPHTLAALWVLGQLYVNHGNATEAEPLLRKCLSQWEEVYDIDHPTNQIVRRKLAACLTLLGLREEAEEILSNALVSDVTTADMYSCYYNQTIGLLVEDGREQEARELLDDMRKKGNEVESEYGTDHELAKEYRNDIAKLNAALATNGRTVSSFFAGDSSLTNDEGQNRFRKRRVELLGLDEIVVSTPATDYQRQNKDEQEYSGR